MTLAPAPAPAPAPSPTPLTCRHLVVADPPTSPPPAVVPPCALDFPPLDLAGLGFHASAAVGSGEEDMEEFFALLNTVDSVDIPAAAPSLLC